MECYVSACYTRYSLMSQHGGVFMRLGWAKKGDSISYYVQKTVYINGKSKSNVVKRLGSEKYICQTYGVSDAKAWAKEQVATMNQTEQEDCGNITLNLSPTKDMAENQLRCFHGGYLFLQDIYYELGLDKICIAIAKKHSFEYNLNAIVSRLIYSRVIFPSSKRSTYEDSHKFVEQPDFELHHIYRALTVLAEASDYIQSRLFKNSLKIAERKTGIIYYDCTNFFFEIEEAEGDKQYGLSKENRPLPIVGMGLFMDAEGIPLAFSINPGNENEQRSLIPLEEKLLKNFDMSKFVVCTDAGLSSAENRKFNDYDEEDGSRAFVTTQSIKKLKAYQAKWALDYEGWYLLSGSDGCQGKCYSIHELDEEKDRDKVFYKSRWINEGGLEQQLIVTYSIRYKHYQREVRSRQIERARRKVTDGKAAVESKRTNDPRRFIKAVYATQDGEIADKTRYYVEDSVIEKEEQYDGFYAVCTNLEDDAEAIVKINRRRWEIEECFRIMKREFVARPVYLHRKERIQAHFITCFIALIVYRYLEKKLDDQFTCNQIIAGLREMNFLKFEGKGYIPTYARTTLSDALHQAFGFSTSKEIIPIKTMRSICALTKKSTQTDSLSP